jgi:hypothetical protein
MKPGFFPGYAVEQDLYVSAKSNNDNIPAPLGRCQQLRGVLLRKSYGTADSIIIPVISIQEYAYKFGVNMKGRKLFVGNLTYTVNARQLRELFSRYGEVTGVNVLEKKGYGFVEMKTQEEAEKARNALSETEFEGRNLLIDGVRPPLRKKKSHEKPSAPRPGQRTQARAGGRPPATGHQGGRSRNDQRRTPGRTGSRSGRGPARANPHQSGRGRR